MNIYSITWQTRAPASTVICFFLVSTARKFSKVSALVKGLDKVLVKSVKD